MSAVDDPKMPDVLQELVPEVGSIWWWEPEEPHARRRVRVTRTLWNGEEVWVESIATDGEPGQRPYLNTLSRWMEACVLVENADGS